MHRRKSYEARIKSVTAHDLEKRVEKALEVREESWRTEGSKTTKSRTETEKRGLIKDGVETLE